MTIEQEQREQGQPLVLCPSSQHMDDGEDLVLLELEPGLLSDLDAKDSWVFKGPTDDHQAVLCTGNSTFSVRRVLTSNTLLLLPSHGTSPKTTTTRLYEYLECSRILPRLETLEELLEAYPYKGPLQESRRIQKDFELHQKMTQQLSTEALLECIQASPAELQIGLEACDAIHMDGAWRRLDKKYVHSVLELILLSMAELGVSDMTKDAIKFSDLAAALVDHDIPSAILGHILKGFSSKFSTVPSSLESKSGLPADYVVYLSPDAIARFIGEHLLLFENWNGAASKDFLKAWEKVICTDSLSLFPSPYMGLLRGLAFIDEEGQVVRYLPKSSLERDPKSRFQQLFLTKKKWARQDMLPYVEDLVESSPSATAAATAINIKKLDSLFLKYTRSVKEAGIVFYTGRIK